MATSSTLPPKPTFGSHEWFTRIITPSYSAGAIAATNKSAATGNAESLIASGRPATVAPSTMWPPLTATTSPAAITSTACTPRPSMALAPPFTAFGVTHDRTRGEPSEAPLGMPPCWHGRVIVFAAESLELVHGPPSEVLVDPPCKEAQLGAVEGSVIVDPIL